MSVDRSVAVLNNRLHHKASPPNQVRRKKEATDASCLPGTSRTTLRLLLGARGARRPCR